MNERGSKAQAARRIAAEHGISLRQAYRYARAGRTPSGPVLIGVDGRRYHVHYNAGAPDVVAVRRIRYTMASVGRRATQHGISERDLAELEAAAERINDLVAVWKACIVGDGNPVTGQEILST